MRRGWSLSLTIVFCWFLAAGGASADDEWGERIIPKGSPIKIGLAVALSGDMATLGVGIKNGVEMAVTEKGQIMGHELVLQDGDDRCQQGPSVALADTFCSDPLVVGVVGYTCDNGAIKASDIHHKHKVVMMSPSSTSLELTARGIPVLFRTCWNDKVQGKAAAAFALKRKKIKVAVLHDDTAYGQSLAEEFKRNISAGGGEVELYEEIERGNKDLSSVLAKIKSEAPQLVYFGGMAETGALLVREIKGLKVKSKFMCGDRCYSEKDFMQAAGKSAKGAFVTRGTTPVGANFVQWKKRFESKYGPLQDFSPYAYDAANILMTAVEKVARKQDDGSLVIGKKALRDAVASTPYEGVTGRITFDEYGDRTDASADMYRVVCKKGRCSFKKLKD